MRAMRQRIVVVVVAAVSAVAGCGTGAAGHPPATPLGPGTAAGSTEAPTPTPTPTLVMIIRHGEKPDGTDASGQGVDPSSRPDDHSLTQTGWDRAYRLADLFDPTRGPPRAGLARPAAVYAAGANDEGEGARTRETVAPLAERLGVVVDTGSGKGDEEALIESASAGPGPALISWAHGEILAIADAFPSVTPAPPVEWPDDRFDVVWTFTRTVDGWRFAQVPELVLPQDRADVIDSGSGR